MRAEHPSSTGVFVAQWLENPTDVTELISFIPTWNTKKSFQLFLHSLSSKYLYISLSFYTI